MATQRKQHKCPDCSDEVTGQGLWTHGSTRHAWSREQYDEIREQLGLPPTRAARAATSRAETLEVPELLEAESAAPRSSSSSSSGATSSSEEGLGWLPSIALGALGLVLLGKVRR
jgi:hypothetical protein